MNSLASHFIAWALDEFILSAALFVTYLLLSNRKLTASNRYLFLKFSFVSLPLIPFFALFFKSNASSVTDSTTGISPFYPFHVGTLPSTISTTALGWLILALITFYAIAVAYGLLTAIRATIRLKKLSRSGERITPIYEIPVIIHAEGLPPGTFGIFKPVILIPRKIYESASSDDLNLIVYHEKLHIYRHDSFFNWARILLRGRAGFERGRIHRFTGTRGTAITGFKWDKRRQGVAWRESPDFVAESHTTLFVSTPQVA